jgi:hypothetical protein
MNADRIIEALETLTAAELRRVVLAGQTLLAQIEEWQQPIEETTTDTMSYQLEWVRCGKATCKRCAQGKGHGPYWYGYYTKNGKRHKKYIGKEKP